MISNPLDRMSDTTNSTTGADGCDQLPESLKFAYTELEPRPRVFMQRCLFFHAWLCTLSLTEYQEPPLPFEQSVQT